MKAKKKPVDSVKLADLAIGDIDSLEIISIEEPETRAGGVIVESVDELINKLKTEAKII